MYCDAHCHLLPRMDNGPITAEESAAMLKVMEEAGTCQAVIVSHFDPQSETVNAYLKRRRARIKELRRAISIHLSRSIQMRFAAQVPLQPGISRHPQLMQLCVEGTNLLPIEMPYNWIERWMLSDLTTIMQKRKITPVICHVERYAMTYSERDFMMLTSLPKTLFQISTAALTDATTMEKFRDLLQDGSRLILGSNAHGLMRRPPVTVARQIQIDQYHATDCYNRLAMNTQILLRPVFK